MFVAVGITGTMIYSTDDGLTWSTVPTANTTLTTNAINAINFADGYFVITGGATTPPVAYSSNGLSWTALTNPITGGSASGQSVAYGDNTLVFGTRTGKIGYSIIPAP